MDQKLSSDKNVIPQNSVLGRKSQHDLSAPPSPSTASSSLTFIAMLDEGEMVLFSQEFIFDDGEPVLAPAPPQSPTTRTPPRLQTIPSDALDFDPSLRFAISSIYYPNIWDDVAFSTKRRWVRGGTQTSSTLGGLDVYMKGTTLARTHRNHSIYSFLNLKTDFTFDPNLKQLGDSNLVKYREGDAVSLSWTAIEPLEAEDMESRRPVSESPSSSGRRLRKRRRGDSRDTDSSIASPRPTLHHVPAAALSLPNPHNRGIFIHMKEVVNGLKRLTKKRGETEWIWVDDM
jgi:hypothetical protein